MNRLYYIIAFILFLGCSSEEISDDNSGSNIPEYFEIVYEIKGQGKASKIRYAVNDDVVEIENDSDDLNNLGLSLPFRKEIRYKTENDGHVNPDGTTSSGCDQLFISAYLNRNDSRVEEINIYANGKLVAHEDESEGYYYTPGEHWTPWSVYFEYLRKGSDPNRFRCSN